MRLFLFLTLFQLCIFSFGQAPNKTANIDLDSLLETKTKEAIDKPFPNFVAENEKGKINNNSLLGKVVLINFWFEGCHPCLAEFGALNELAQKLKGNEDFEFISFTSDNMETIERVKEQYNLQFKVFSIHAKECSRLNQNNGYPTTIILDKQGKIKYLVSGGTNDIEKAKEFVMTTLLPKIQKEL
jgi:thiol-disulfide isomerase/thioredoxin